VKIRTIGIVGAGQMGCGIAHVAATAGFDVVLTDLDTAILADGTASIADNLDRQIRRGTVEASERDAILGRIDTSNRVRAHAGCDLVIESAVERFEITDFMAHGHNPDHDLPVDGDRDTRERLRAMVALIFMSPSFLWR
jgi:3-hydroxyacyl-CoA dehydrogenase